MMVLLIDTLNNSICLYEPATKKAAAFFSSMTFEYPLSEFENQKMALMDFLSSDESKPLHDAKSTGLIITDLHIGFGAFDLPALSKFRVKDVFDTRFKLCYPNFEQLYVHNYEYERSNTGVLFQYSFAQKKNIDEILDILKKNDISAVNIEYFSSHFVAALNKTETYPQATFVLGAADCEIIITRADKVVGIYNYGYGTNLLESGIDFLNSAYGPGHDNARRFAGFTKENFANRIPVTDENIGKMPPESGMMFNKPKETRVLKDQALANYNVKNNYRKLLSSVVDVLNRYAAAPYFLPLNEIKVIARDESFDLLNEAAKEFETARLVHIGFDLQNELGRSFANNPLFKGGVMKERRKIDWAKLLTMEIGGKKKA